jgi:NADH-quinone oxidoreductase subunit J
MNITLQQVVFYVVAVLIAFFSVMTVTTKHILRSATYLLFVLFGTAMLYFILDYTFLGAAQIIVYAGGIVVLYVFSILLTRSDKSLNQHIKKSKLAAAAVTALGGGVIILFCIFSHSFAAQIAPSGNELDMEVIGQTLMGSGKYQYLLPFEAVSILLLACMIGGIVIARKK